MAIDGHILLHGPRGAVREANVDPEQTLKDAKQALRAGDLSAARAALATYQMWRDAGGFEPRNGDERARVLAFACARGYL